MDWSAVIKNLRRQTEFYTQKAQYAGPGDRLRWEASADTASILASALSAGNEQQPVSLAEMRQPEEREKNERMKALIDVVGQSTPLDKDV